jgi:hypothetical protein
MDLLVHRDWADFDYAGSIQMKAPGLMSRVWLSCRKGKSLADPPPRAARARDPGWENRRKRKSARECALHLRGQHDEADAVEQQGEILCSVCFPSAPVEWTNGTSNNDKAAKAERAALKAERLAKKTAKALVPEDIDGGLVVFVGNERNRRERITTLAAAKTWLTDWAEYSNFNNGGHPAYPNDVAQHIAQVYAARIGSTPEAEIEAAKKRAAKRR